MPIVGASVPMDLARTRSDDPELATGELQDPDARMQTPDVLGRSRRHQGSAAPGIVCINAYTVIVCTLGFFLFGIR